MAVNGTFPVRVEDNLKGLAFVLRSAVCEWLLLFLLLLDAAFSYFITKFAQYCELQLPCLFCSRLDHVLGKEKPDFYKNLICRDHKVEISSLVLCHNHGKLADINGMCEECLLSCVKKETNEETYKLLLRKLGPDCFQKPLLSVNTVPGSLRTRLCSCCLKPWRIRPQVQKLVHSEPSASVSKPDIPLPKSPAHRCLNRQEGLKKRKDRLLDFDALSHVGYTKVKITSDSESDFPFSDDDEVISAPRDRRKIRDEYFSQQGSNHVAERQYDDIPLAAQIQKPTHITNISLHPDLEPEMGETTTPNFSVLTDNASHSLAEIKWQQIRKKTTTVVPDFNSLDDIPLSSSAPERPAVVSANEGERVPLSKKFQNSGLLDIIHKPSLPSAIIVNSNVSAFFSTQRLNIQSKENLSGAEQNDGSGHAYVLSNCGSNDLNSYTTASDIKMDPMRKDAAVVTNSFPDVDLRQLPPKVRSEGKISGFSSGLSRRRDYNGIGSADEISNLTHCIPLTDLNRRDHNGTGSSEETSDSKISVPLTDVRRRDFNEIGSAEKIRHSKFSDALTESSSSKTSARNEHSDEPQMSENPAVETVEGSVSDFQGENIADSLRREIEHSKKHISDLNKELEEERNAAAIAANQAMAMITKLQEEKAALRMEALQYLRMMEEQAEYDVDELEKANDVVSEKEKQIQDLEAELDYFRMKYPEEFPEYSDIVGEDLGDAQLSHIETTEIGKL